MTGTVNKDLVWLNICTELGTISSAGAGPGYHFPGSGAGSSREEERKQPVYLSHQARYGGVEAKSERDSRARLTVAPPAHVQPIALTTTRTGSFTSGYPVPSLALATNT